MNLKEERYRKFALVREMMETSGIIRSFDPAVSERFVNKIKLNNGLFMTGEGSSRLFPAKRAIYSNMKKKFILPVITEGCTQAREYNLDDFSVFTASNSGQTKEVIRLVKILKEKNHKAIYALTANKNTKLEEFATDTHVLSCGKEDAVAATKSVIEQGLFYDSLLRNLRGEKMEGLKALGDKTEEVLTAKIDKEIIDIIKNADVLYWAGRDNGVAAELALKTNEITRKKSDFLEGTYALHGIEEVMDKNEVLIWVDPFDVDQDKFLECLVKNVGIRIIAISSQKTMFPTIEIPQSDQYSEYLQLTAGWNILVETGVALGIDLDHPKRARKVGNEYVPE
ncbi:MAG TPA: SIS domain-containing protein [Bacteroidales bacterium]|jgi:glucosamine--fructose-6-phosphate aminotransferase (isomerizing)|nr:SIS domain-containing protein [Bacteroidales bacterium]OQB60835.1 MAG: glucosamine--fructose-6-phosphate aminotransferase [Bacteroidetes bacterium ADurb.Bin145]NMD03626.1 SIS domain-containing protein [Bacteroidales bacterium]HOU02360.1 SIS domain-containing protein [Bacteroidales bacterium]HQG62788.1 SIS domain-containing protein [Bacteroidales bacterium]